MRRSIVFGLVGLVVVGVGAGTAVALTGDDPKTVSLKVDQEQSSVKTRAHTVQGVLSSRKLVVAQHDVIAPAVTTKVRNGTEIVLKRGRLLHLTIDGVERDVWTTAPTVAEALAELGYTSDDFSSVSRDKRLPLSPTEIELRTPKQVRVVHDGRNDSVTTTAATVGQLLTDLRITVNAADRLSVPVSSKVADRSTVRLQRVVTKTLVERHTIGYSTTQRQDASLYRGETKVATAGKAGTSAVTYRMVYVDGKLTGKTQVARTVTASPVTAVVNVGTKARPAPAPAPAPAPSPRPAPSPAPAPVSGGGGLNWDGVAACESGGNWSINTGNGYYGGLQFDISTWLNNGGGAYASRPDLASKAQQISVATALYQKAGSAPWPVCGRYL